MTYFLPMLALSCLPVFPDTVTLANGSVLDGKVTVDGDRVVVEMDFGKVTLGRKDVKKIAYDRSPIQELEERAKSVKMDDADAVYALGAWAQGRELETRAKELYQRAISLNPEHSAARAALGFRKHEDRWMTDEQYFAATGMVKFRGAWVKREEADKVELAEREQRHAAVTQNLIADGQKLVLEAQAELLRAQAEVERVKAEIERAKANPFGPNGYPVAVIHYHMMRTGYCPCACPAGNAPAPAQANSQKK